MIDDDFRPGFRARLHLKDARIVLDTARELGANVPGFGPPAEALGRLVEQGDGELDHSALFTLVRGPGARSGANEHAVARSPGDEVNGR